MELGVGFEVPNPEPPTPNISQTSNPKHFTNLKHLTFYIKEYSKISMNFSQAVAYLETLQKEDAVKREWNLQGIEELLHKLNNPEKHLGTIIHVTGTNGKGSVCAMTANILKEAGYKVGLYTSPHLKRITERIQINNQEITEEDFAYFVQKINILVTNQSFFEVMTAIAFLYFAEKHVDCSVIEVGLGGKLDATNIVESTVSVITNISLEHTERLGATEKAIAEEKAGIIKKGNTCVTAAKGDALAVIQQRCQEKNVPLISAIPTREFTLGLSGEIQKSNAGTALAVINILQKKGFVIPRDAIKTGFKTVHWPARLEFIEPNILIDVAHNPAGIKQLAQELQRCRQEKKYQNIVFIIGILADKDWKTMLDYIIPIADRIILTRPKSNRAANPFVLKEYLQQKNNNFVLVIEDCHEALSRAKQEAGKKDLLVVTGSFYTGGPIYPF